MTSIALDQYPRVVWEGGQRYLWNPVHRKGLKNRPEERVRLRVLEYLLEAGWPRTRISTEEPVRDHTGAALRTDLVCYSRDFEPELLVECKAEHVPLSGETALQGARYNRAVEAPLLLLTNGITDYWYRVGNRRKPAEKLDRIPETFYSHAPSGRDIEYWKGRGFSGPEPSQSLSAWLEKVLSRVFSKSPESVQYLTFSSEPAGYPADHYYRVYRKSDRLQLALSVTSTPSGETHLLGIMNHEGENKALLQIHLDRVFAKQSPDTIIYSAKGAKEFALEQKYGRTLEAASGETEGGLPGMIFDLLQDAA